MSVPFRLFHFDIATENNFGDTLLFPAVKHMFEAYGAGEAFDVYDSRPLRENVGPSLVHYINRTADAVVVGGGGLFLADTNPNRESGWQWRISREMLDLLEVPLIVFAVGYNRFYGQPDFDPPFAEHIAQTIEQSAFFGLRNHGSIEMLSKYIPAELSEHIAYQPCPTTLTNSVLPFQAAQSDAKRIGVQLSNSRTYSERGVSTDTVLQAAGLVLPLLENAGWEVVFTPFTELDHAMSSRLEESFVQHEVIHVYGENVLSRGINDLSRIPFLLGCRGHAQMIPFGLGAIPFSFDVHPKLRYFLTDISRPQWIHDPNSSTFATDMFDTIEDAWNNREENRAHIRAKQAEFADLTLANLDSIYSALGGDTTALRRRWKSYDAQAWNIARNRFLLEVQRENSIHRHHTLDAQMREVKSELDRANRDIQTALGDRKILEKSMFEDRLKLSGVRKAVERLESENQMLRDEVNRLQGHTAKKRVGQVMRTAKGLIQRGNTNS